MRVLIEMLAAGVLALAVAAFSWFDVGVQTGATERTVKRVETSQTERVQTARSTAAPSTAAAASSTC